jgi:hypothetical protein
MLLVTVQRREGNPHMTNEPEIIDKLHVALSAAQAEMPNAVFNRVNPHFKSKYADLAAIREATLPALSKHGLSINHETKILLESGYTLLIGILSHGASGQQQRAEWLITATTPQGRGSELTYGRRYTWGCLTGIVAEEDDDANAAQAVSKETVSNVALGDVPTLPKKQSRGYYEELVKEMRALTDREALRKWWIESGPRRRMMHSDFQRWLLRDAENHETTIEEGVTEEGRTVSEIIDDIIPNEGSGEVGSTSR